MTRLLNYKNSNSALIQQGNLLYALATKYHLAFPRLSILEGQIFCLSHA